MKYYFIADKKDKRHIIAAHNEENAKRIALNSNKEINYIYELMEDTFKDEGFLMSDK